MNESQPTQTQATAPIPIAEANLFLPRGRIGICSMLFRWIVCFCLLAVTGLLTRQMPDDLRQAVSVCIAYPVKAFTVITGIKRAHDMGYSAWGVILLAILPILFLLPGAKQSNQYGTVPTRWL
jgi:hypothetical protein